MHYVCEPVNAKRRSALEYSVHAKTDLKHTLAKMRYQNVLVPKTLPKHFEFLDTANFFAK